MARFAAVLLTTAALSLGGLACDSPSGNDDEPEALDFHLEQVELLDPPAYIEPGGAHFEAIHLPPLTPITEP